MAKMQEYENYIVYISIDSYLNSPINLVQLRVFQRQFNQPSFPWELVLGF